MTDAWTQGYDAYISGVVNPYSNYFQYELWKLWYDGYYNAQEHAERRY